MCMLLLIVSMLQIICIIWYILQWTIHLVKMTQGIKRNLYLKNENSLPLPLHILRVTRTSHYTDSLLISALELELLFFYQTCPLPYHTVQPNRTHYRIHHISDRQREGLLRIIFVIYGTPFQHIFNYLKISSIIWRYILYLQIFEDIFNSYEFIFK